MKDNDEVRIAWVIWSLLSHLNDRLWDRYEEEFLEILSHKDQMQGYEKSIFNLLSVNLPF
jgi:hypothetical protein